MFCSAAIGAASEYPARYAEVVVGPEGVTADGRSEQLGGENDKISEWRSTIALLLSPKLPGAADADL